MVYFNVPCEWVETNLWHKINFKKIVTPVPITNASCRTGAVRIGNVYSKIEFDTIC